MCWSPPRRARFAAGWRDNGLIRPAFRVAAATLLLQFGFGLVFSWGAVAPHARAEGWSPLLIGAVFSATPLGFGMGTVLGGRLADRLPPRRLCWAAMALFGAGLGVALLLPSGATFVLFYSFLGLGVGGGIGLAASVAAGIQVLPRSAGAVGGALTAAYALAAAVQVPVVSRLVPPLGWLGALRLTGAALVLLAGLGLTVMPRLPAPRRPGQPGPAGITAILRRPRVWTACLFVLSAAPLGSYAFVNIVTFSLSRGFGLAAATAGLVGMALGNAAGRAAGGVASDRLGVDVVMAAILFCDVAAAAMLAWAPGQAAVMIGAVLAGLGLGGGAGLVSRAAADAAADAPGSALGLMFAAYAAGACLGPLLGAAVGAGPGTWLALGALSLGGLAMVALRLASSPKERRVAVR